MFPITAIKAVKAVTVASVLACTLLSGGCASGPQASQSQVRSDDTFRAIQRGMTKDEVLRLLGPPDQTMRFPLTGNEAWDYRYQDTWGYMAVFSVTFGPDARVVDTVSIRLNDGGDREHGKRR
jgi:outer membrane protein assembly factor BamE (lipoprotein component of BamABCDE complex)